MEKTMYDMTREFVDEVDDVMSIAMKNINLDMIANLSPEELLLWQKTMGLLNKSKKMLIVQAGMLDDINRKLDKLLENTKK